MSTPDHVVLMANYNAWMNTKIYETAAKLAPEALALDPVRATDLPTALNQILFNELSPLAAHRQMLDGVINEWAASLTEADLGRGLIYANTRGEPFKRRFSSLVMHFFNHQTHHRGQATTLLMQAGLDVGVTDLLALIPTAP